VIVSEAIVNVVPSTGCFNQPALSQHLEMLGRVRHGLFGLLCERLHRSRPLRQQVDQFKTPPTRHRFREPRELIVKLILKASLVAGSHAAIKSNT
jgi:hypothetical protein